MPIKEQQVAIIALDGLSAAQFEKVLSQMPRLNALVRGGKLSELNSAPFSDAKPIWAEMLTGSPWYRNGCAGYAAPLHSLTELKQFSESDLGMPAILLPEVGPSQFNIVINVPILEPRAERIWIADASSPTMTTISPMSYAENEPFRSYKARPIISMGQAFGDPLAASKFMESERKRTECARTLAKTCNWKLLIYRTSIFDELSHLFGPTYLDHNQLKISAEIKQLLSTLDEALCDAISRATKIVLLSAFSHTDCQELFSLNDLFKRLKLLKQNLRSSVENNLRRQAFALISSTAAPPLVSSTSRIIPAETICASPVRGAVYINSSSRFTDGIVAPETITKHEDQIIDFIRLGLDRFSGRLNLVRNNDSNSKAPNFVLNADGLELVDDLSTIKRIYDLPRSVHNSQGFVWCNATNSKPIRPVELTELIKELA